MLFEYAGIIFSSWEDIAYIIKVENERPQMQGRRQKKFQAGEEATEKTRPKITLSSLPLLYRYPVWIFREATDSSAPPLRTPMRKCETLQKVLTKFWESLEKAVDKSWTTVVSASQGYTPNDTLIKCSSSFTNRAICGEAD